MNTAEQIEECAAQWLARREQPAWSSDDESELQEWRREATAHEVAYLRMEHGWRKVNRLAALRTPRSAAVLPGRRQHDGMHFGRPKVWGVAVSALLALCIVGWITHANRGDRYTTAVGAHQAIPLADGSRIELNTDSRLRTTLDETARRVWLEQGEAYFDVARDETKPFVVYAGSRRVTVLGTEFAVRLDGDQARVIVSEGRVRIESLSGDDWSSAAIVSPGDNVIASDDGVKVVRVSAEKISQSLSWRQGRLVFDQTTLAQAVAEFNRYNAKQLLIEDPAVASIRIGGNFEATNVAAFARILNTSFHLRVRESEGHIRVGP